MFGDIARSHAAGRVRFLPLHYSGIWQYLAAPAGRPRAAPGEPAGRARDAAASASRSTSCRRCCPRRSSSWPRSTRPCRARRRATPSPIARLDYVIPTERPLLDALPSGPPSEETQRIAAHVASLIADGDTIQIGIGKAAGRGAGRAAGHRRDLGAAQRAGRRPGRRPARGRRDHRRAQVAGSRPHRRAPPRSAPSGSTGWAGGCPELELAPVELHPRRRACWRSSTTSSRSTRCWRSISPARPMPRCCDGRQVSGTGGLLDFVRGARLSAGRPLDPRSARDRGRRQGLAHRGALRRGRRRELPARRCRHRGHRARHCPVARQIARGARPGAARHRRPGVPRDASKSDGQERGAAPSSRAGEPA